MENMLERIYSRRSVRSFTEEVIPDEDLEKLLSAAIYAPTGRNSQPLFYVIVKDQEKKNSILDQLGIRKNFYDAPYILFSFARQDDYLNDLNVGAAIDNVCLLADEMGIATCWIHSARKFLDTDEGRKVLKEVLELDQEYRPLECCAIGKIKGEKPQMKERNLDGNKII